MKITTLNMQAAALPRAKRLLDWLDDRDDDVVILTETSEGPGTEHLLSQCQAAGWSIVANGSPGDRGCAIVSRLPLQPANALGRRTTIPGRVAAAHFDTDPAVTIVGLYVPSNDRTPVKTAKKQEFLASVRAALLALPAAQRSHLVVGGDYNLITRDHQPPYPGVFLPSDYAFLESLTGELGLLDAHRRLHPTDQPHSWIGHNGYGYRYDYLHLSPALATTLTGSVYQHETRTGGLSDHAAVTIDLDIATGHLLDTAPAALASAGALF